MLEQCLKQLAYHACIVGIMPKSWLFINLKVLIDLAIRVKDCSVRTFFIQSRNSKKNVIKLQIWFVHI